MTPDDLRALADAIVYRDSLAIARAADYLRACADAEPVAWLRPENRLREESTSQTRFSFGKSRPPIGTWQPLYARPAQAAAKPCWCHKCNEGRLVNGIPFAMTQMIVCPICGNKRCPHASDHALACTASNDSMAVSATPQAEPTEAQIVAVAEVLLAWEAEIFNRVSARVLAEDVIRAALAAKDEK